MKPNEKRNRKVERRGGDFSEAVSPRALEGDPGYVDPKLPEDAPKPKRERGKRSPEAIARRNARRMAKRRAKFGAPDVEVPGDGQEEQRPKRERGQPGAGSKARRKARRAAERAAREADGSVDE